MKKQISITPVICCAVLGITFFAFAAVANEELANIQENSGSTGSAVKSAEDKDGHLGEGSFYLGFHWVESDDFSRLAEEYEDDESSLMLGMQLETFPLPHRFFIDGEYLGAHDYYGELGYSYRDIILFRNLAVGLHHNLDHYNYLLPDDPPGVTYEDRNIGDENFVDFTKNDLYLRLKAPDYPLHTFAKHRYVEREGSLQERYLIGYFGGLNKTSESRAIDWKSNDLTLGMNSHLGPVEVEYSHNRFEFDPGSGSVLYDYFAAGRPADTYPHNVIPETESFGNTLKFHTSYTGEIVASATLSNEEGTNNYSGAESEAWKGAFDLQWIPDPVVSLFLRYRHLELDKENPEHLTLYGLSSRISYEVRPPVSTKKDLLSLSARYRPMGRLTLNGNYEYEMRERTDVDEWVVLPEDSDIHRINLTASARLMNSLKLKGVYQYQRFDNPSYNTEPDHSNKVRMNASFTPASWISAALDYSITLTKRDDLVYVNGTSLIEQGERDGRTDHALGSVSFVLSPRTSLTASWAYNRWKIEQDTAYSMWNATGTSTTALPYYDLAAPYTDQSNTFALSLYSKLRTDLDLKASISCMIAESEYLPTPSYLTLFTDKDTTETVATVELAKKLMQDWEVGLKVKAGFYEDAFSDNTMDRDGELYLTTLTLKRYF